MCLVIWQSNASSNGERVSCVHWQGAGFFFFLFLNDRLQPVEDSVVISPVCRSHMYAGYLPVSGPLDFRLVIQVLLSPRMFLNACVRRLHPCLTSLAEDAALPHLVTHKSTAAQCPGRGSNPDRCRGRRVLYPLSYIPSFLLKYRILSPLKCLSYIIKYV